MSEGPNLTLPPRDRWGSAPPSRRPPASLVVGVLLAAVLGLQVYLAVRPAPSAPAPADSRARKPLIPFKDLKDVALKLRRDNLHAAAAAAYDEYLAAADLSDEDRGNLLLESGKLMARAGRYEDALARYFRAELLVSEANLAPLRRDIQECLGRLGKHSEQGYELSDRTAARPGKGGGKTAGDQEAGAVVAWMGPEKITSSELDDLIAQEIEDRLAALPGVPPERLAEIQAQAQKKYSAPQARLAKLQEILARRVLYREGIERKVDDDARVQKRIADFRREAVVEEMVYAALRERIKVSETDLRNFFRANPARYRERARAQVRIALLKDEAAARELLLAAKTEDDFSRLAREKSEEPATREKGGLLDEPVLEGDPVPVLGPAPELVKAIFETAPAHAVPAPVKLASGFAVAFVRNREPERSPTFEEARERVGRDYLQEKQAEVQSELVKELFQKHGVSIATETFIPGAKAERAPSKKDDQGTEKK